jgi:hypothetical protein
MTMVYRRAGLTFKYADDVDFAPIDLDRRRAAHFTPGAALAA